MLFQSIMFTIIGITRFNLIYYSLTALPYSSQYVIRINQPFKVISISHNNNYLKAVQKILQTDIVSKRFILRGEY